MFPVGAVLRVEAIKEGAGGVEATEVEVGLEEVVADGEAVDGDVKVGFGELDDLGQVGVVTKISAELDEEIGGGGTGGAGEGLGVDGEGRGQVAMVEGGRGRAQRRARQAPGRAATRR